MRRSDLDNKPLAELHRCYRLCAKHFGNSQFMNEKQNALTWNAVPTLFDIPNVVTSKRTRRIIVRHKTDTDASAAHPESCNDDVNNPDAAAAAAQVQDDDEPQARKSQVPGTLTSDNSCKSVPHDTPRKVKLKHTISNLRRRLSRAKQRMTSTAPSASSVKGLNLGHRLPAKRHAALLHALSELERLLPSATYNFVRSQVRMSLVQKQGRRWSPKDKLFAMSVFYQSRKAYKLLQKIFILPSQRTLQRSLQKCNIYPGFSSSITDTLAVKVKHMSEQEKQCVLVFDEMALKTKFVYNRDRDCIDGFEDLGVLGTTQYHCDHALVFMLRGVSVKWKQPVGYFLVNGSVKPAVLNQLVQSCLDKLLKIGLLPMALVCDQGATNRCFLKSMCSVSLEQPYILHNNRRIFVIYDPPHLLKNIRNNLKKHDFVVHSAGQDHKICWEYVQKFYDFDKTMPVRMAPKLTDKHLELPPFTSMRVNLAAQVLSHSVAAGMQTLCCFGKLPEEATHTAQFIDKFDKLFNAFNSRTVKSSQPMGHPFTRTSGHEKFFSEMLNYLDNLHLADSCRSLPCIFGWKLSIMSLLEIWKLLSTEKSYQFLLTSRLNQDCVENLFSVIRGSGGHRDNPNVSEFRASFRFIAVNKLFVPVSGTNCEMDCDGVLLDAASLSAMHHQSRDNRSVNIHTNATCELVCEDDFDADFSTVIMSTEYENVVAYMSGYLLRKFSFSVAERRCESCADLFLTDSTTSNNRLVFVRQKSYRESGALLYPSALFCNFIIHLEEIFRHVFCQLRHSVNITERIFLYAEKNVQVIGCGQQQCIDVVKEIMKLYIRVRIYSETKLLTVSTTAKSTGKRNRKAKKIVHE